MLSETTLMKFRKEEYSVNQRFYIDEETGEEYATSESTRLTMNELYNKYRERHNIPFPDEIKAIREMYGFSLSRMSQLLGFGENQYSLYEKGEIPSKSNAALINAIKDPAVLKNNSAVKFEDLEERERNKINELINMSYLHKEIDLIKMLIEGDKRKSSFNGFTSCSFKKVEQVVFEIISHVGSVYETKLNKLLFYVDFLSYKRHGVGVTGLTYQAIQYGPVPNQYATLYNNTSTIEPSTIFFDNGNVGVRYNTKQRALANEEGLLSEQEINIITHIANLFKNSTAQEISNISHEEKAWIENNATRSIIDYSTAAFLNID